MQTGSAETLIGWKSRKTTYVPVWDRICRESVAIDSGRDMKCIQRWETKRGFYYRLPGGQKWSKTGLNSHGIYKNTHNYKND